MNSRLKWISRAVVCAALVVAGRAFTIQVLKDERLERMARRQFQSKVLLSPKRGTILDRNGEALAVNIESQSLAANPAKLRNRRDLLRLLSRALDIPFERLRQKVRDKRDFTWIRRHLSESDLNLLKKMQVIAADGDLPEGLWLVRESKRVYPHHELASQLLGGTNVDSDGTEGVELWFNSRLKGKFVSVDATKDALGRATFLDAAAAGSVQDGEPVKLTIDASLQYAIEQELKFSVAQTGARGGSVIVMNAVNGEILALANEPSFDPNFRTAPGDHRRNRVLTDGYEPGSTLKPVLLASALSSGMKLSDQVWGNRGSFTVQGRRISEAESHERYEWISLKRMIQVSSNVGSAKLAMKIGADAYAKTLQQLGFGSRTGMGFPGEITGKVPPRKSWQPLTLANIGFGQGILVTPIQMARAYAAFLNGGWLVQPTLVQNPSQGDPSQSERPRRVLSPAVAEQVQEALSLVTQQDGTGEKAALEGYEVAGKTGTAQTVDPLTRKYSKSRFIASFVGFARGVEPRLVIYAALDGPKGVYYASETAAPLFRRALQAVVNRFSIPADPGLMVVRKSQALAGADSPTKSEVRNTAQGSDTEEPEIFLAAKKHEDRADTASPPSWIMPSVVGLTAREALRALHGQPFELEMLGEGIVKSQAPEAGNAIAGRTQVRLQLGL